MPHAPCAHTRTENVVRSTSSIGVAVVAQRSAVYDFELSKNCTPILRQDRACIGLFRLVARMVDSNSFPSPDDSNVSITTKVIITVMSAATTIDQEPLYIAMITLLVALVTSFCVVGRCYRRVFLWQMGRPILRHLCGIPIFSHYRFDPDPRRVRTPYLDEFRFDIPMCSHPRLTWKLFPRSFQQLVGRQFVIFLCWASWMTLNPLWGYIWAIHNCFWWWVFLTITQIDLGVVGSTGAYWGILDISSRLANFTTVLLVVCGVRLLSRLHPICRKYDIQIRFTGIRGLSKAFLQQADWERVYFSVDVRRPPSVTVGVQTTRTEFFFDGIGELVNASSPLIESTDESNSQAFDEEMMDDLHFDPSKSRLVGRNTLSRLPSGAAREYSIYSGLKISLLRKYYGCLALPADVNRFPPPLKGYLSEWEYMRFVQALHARLDSLIDYRDLLGFFERANEVLEPRGVALGFGFLHKTFIFHQLCWTVPTEFLTCTLCCPPMKFLVDIVDKWLGSPYIRILTWRFLNPDFPVRKPTNFRDIVDMRSPAGRRLFIQWNESWFSYSSNPVKMVSMLIVHSLKANRLVVHRFDGQSQTSRAHLLGCFLAHLVYIPLLIALFATFSGDLGYAFVFSLIFLFVCIIWQVVDLFQFRIAILPLMYFYLLIPFALVCMQVVCVSHVNWQTSVTFLLTVPGLVLSALTYIAIVTHDLNMRHPLPGILRRDFPIFDDDFKRIELKELGDDGELRVVASGSENETESVTSDTDMFQTGSELG